MNRTYGSSNDVKPRKETIVSYVRIGPQPGPQEQFLSSSADITIYGGAAGGGKTWACLLEPLRHYGNGDFGAVIFRRTSPQITNEGGMWDESWKIYPKPGLDGKPNNQSLHWTFPTGMTVSFAHLQHEHSIYAWQGAQIALIIFDELTHFTEKQFFYMLSRNRSMSGVHPYVRCTCNPDPDSWVATFIAWWIDQDTGYPIPERVGKIRWFMRDGDEIVWADNPDDLEYLIPDDVPDEYRDEVKPKSVTFIPSNVYDNKELLKINPAYLTNLLAQGSVDRERLLRGNWKIRPSAGNVFRRDWFKEVDDAGGKCDYYIRYWDKAGTLAGGAYSVGVLMGYRRSTKMFYVLDVKRGQWNSTMREKEIQQTALEDARLYGVVDFLSYEPLEYIVLDPGVTTVIEQEPGSGGLDSANSTVWNLAGFDVRKDRVTGSKEVRAEPFASAAENGLVCVVRSSWTQAYLDELVGFPDGKYKDQVDASSGAFNRLTLKVRSEPKPVLPISIPKTSVWN